MSGRKVTFQYIGPHEKHMLEGNVRIEDIDKLKRIHRELLDLCTKDDVPKRRDTVGD